MPKGFVDIGESWKIMWELDKRVFIFSAIIGLIDAAIPYVGILLSAYILDGLQAGEDMLRLCYIGVASAGCVFALTVIKSYLQKLRDVRTEKCVRQFEMKISLRTLTMDYQLLESSEVNEARSNMYADKNWGAGFYTMIWDLPKVLSDGISIVISMALLIPLFSEGGILVGGYAFFVPAVIFAVVALSSVYLIKKNKTFTGVLKEFAGSSKYFSYFMFSFQDYKRGKDIRVYKAIDLINSYLSGDEKINSGWINRFTKTQSAIGFTSGLSMGVLQGLAYLFVALRAADGALSVGNVLKYGATIYRFAQSLSALSTDLSQYAISAGRQRSAMAYMSIQDALKKGTLPVEKRSDGQYEIEFKNVSFKYPKTGEYVLKNISMKLNVGKKMAVVGMNGSGKTTMIKLMCRLYDPTEGEITLNGIDIKKYDYEEYMSIFSVVFQDFKLFSFSVAQNVATGTQVDVKRVESCLEKSGVYQRVCQMQKGVDSIIYRNYDIDGVEISGGEAQKIALARAMYKDAPFVILDEPTSALDPIAEFEVYSKFDEMVEDKTAIYISHRLSSCRFCHDIAVFHGGCLVQRGSHEQLIEDENGKYYELWTAQAQYYENNEKVS